jgi:hypothetical protein
MISLAYDILKHPCIFRIITGANDCVLLQDVSIALRPGPAQRRCRLRVLSIIAVEGFNGTGGKGQGGYIFVTIHIGVGHLKHRLGGDSVPPIEPGRPCPVNRIAQGGGLGIVTRLIRQGCGWRHPEEPLIRSRSGRWVPKIMSGRVKVVTGTGVRAVAWHLE